MKKKYKHSSLIGLYISYIFQKGTIIIFGIVLLLMIVFLLLVSNPWLLNTDYLLSSGDIHKGYLEQGIFIVQVFNSVIIAALVIQIIINSNSFDTLFVSYISKRNICYMKLIAIFIVLFLIILFEILILYLIPMLRFSLFKLELENILIIPYLLISMLFELGLSILFTSLYQNIFIPMSVLFFSIIIKVIASIGKVKDVINYFYPIIFMDKSYYKLDIKSMIVGIIVSIISIIIMIKVYERKDLKV